MSTIHSPGDADSGVESAATPESVENTPEKNLSMSTLENEVEDVDNEDLDETLSERLWGLTEMFPSWLRNGVSALVSGSWTGVKALYGNSRTLLWVVSSSSVILLAPVIFEVERAQMEEMQRQQQRQILLGPNAAVSSGASRMGMPMPPPMPAQPR